MTYWGDLSQGADDDPDGDGWTNLQEAAAGTNPTVADAVPPVAMLKSHPRLWMEAGSDDPSVIDEAAVIARTALPAYSGIWSDVASSSNVANQALTYLVNGSASKLTSVKAALATTTTNADQLIYRSLAFDWAYAGFTPAERAGYAANLVTSANSIIDANTYLYGNYGIRYQAASGIAALAAAGDADVSVLWPKAYGRMNTVLEVTGDGIDPSDMEGRMAWGGGWNEGYDYNRHTQIHMLQYLQALRSAFGPHEDRLSASDWAAGVVKFMIYGLLPDGNHMLPFGDNDWPFLLAHDRTIVLLATDASDSTYGQYWLNHVYATDSYWAYTDLLFYDASRAETSFDSLPKGWHFPGIGLAVFRGGWGTNDTYVAFKSSDYHTYHQNNGQNAFYIYKSAPLAVRTGVYDGEVHDHNVNYVIRTIAQNSVTVFDPIEAFSYPDGVPDDNDGGQLVQEWTGEHHNFTEWRAQADRAGTPRNTVDWIAFDSTDTYGYAAAEAGRAYKAGKVPFFSRQILFLPPDYIVVFDRVTSGDAAFQKKFMLHSPEGMTVNGDTAVITTNSAPGTTAPGRLFCKNLLPAGASLALVGGTGNEYYYNGRNHPGPDTYNEQINGLWRLEESAPLEAATYFLNVMYATGAGTASMPNAQVVAETADMVTLSINDGEHVVSFNKTGAVDWAFEAAVPVSVATAALAGGTVGVAYSDTLAATGGTAPYTWSVTAGALPDGLSLSAATGEISGTPIAAGTFDFTVQATDSAAETGAKALEIVIAGAAPSISTTTLPPGAEGSIYSQPLAATGGLAPYRWYVSGSGLPRGLGVDSATGTVSGVPFVSGTFSFTVKVWDAQVPSAFDTQGFTLVVAAADTDGDGMADGWEMEHFGDLSHDPADDADGDGYANVTEERNGTDPSVAETAPPYLSTVHWQSVGLGGGGSQANPTPAPNNPDLMFGVCDMGGFYRSADGGRHWDMVNGKYVNGLPSYAPNDCGPEFDRQNELIALSPRNGGLARTTDGGLTWALVSSVQPTAIAFHATDSSYAVFAGSDNRLYESANAGATWTEDTGWRTVNLGIRELYIDASTATANATIYASTASGVYRSTNGGTSWTLKNTGLASTDVATMDAGMKAGSIVLYCLAGNRIYKTTDGANTWADVTNDLPSTSVSGAVTYTSIGVAWCDPDVAYVGSDFEWGPSIHKTEDGGASWALKLCHIETGSLPATTTVERDWLSIAYDWGWGGPAWNINVCPTDPDVVAMCEYARTFRSDNGGDHWFCVNVEESSLNSNWWRSVGFETTTCYKYVIDPHDASRHYICYTDIGFARSEDSDATWRWSATGSPWQNTFYEIACDPTVAGKMWAAASNSHDIPGWTKVGQDPNTFTGGVVISSDWGVSWADAGHSTGLPTGAVTSILVDPASPAASRTVYAVIFGRGVYKSTDGGVNWTAKNTGLSMGTANTNVYRLERTSDGALYCAITHRRLADGTRLPGGLFKSTNSGDSWTMLNTSYPLYYIQGFSVDPTDSNRIYVGLAHPGGGIDCASGIVRSTDGGATWSNPLSSLDAGIAWHVVPDPEEPNRVWAALNCGYSDPNGEGLYVSEDYGATWTKSPTFPFTNIGGIRPCFDPADSENLYVSTYGGGVWKGTVAHVTAPAAEFTSTPSGPLALAFDSSPSTGTINTWIWDFGDGSSSLEASPTHTYAGAGTYAVTLSVQGSFGTASVSHDVTPAGAVTVTTTTLAAGTVGVSYSATLAAGGGTPPYTWSVVAGAMPDGLTLDPSTGEIAGTPSAAGTFDFTVQAEDNASATAAKALEIVIAGAAPTITTTTLPPAAEGSIYSQPLVAAGGLLPYRWYVSGGGLPRGMSVDKAAGTVSGVPFVSGSFTFTVKVWDAQLPSAYDTQAFTLVVAAADADGDGMADGWEMEHFGDLSHGGTGDTDGDGYIDIAEYRNGTDPATGETVAPYLSSIDWQPVGPGGGGAQYNPGIAPNNPDIMFGFCDMGGIYRSADGGRNWRMYGADEVQFPVAYSPTHCRPAFNPFDENIVFVGAYGGVRRSTDGGTTWAIVRPSSWPTAISIDRGDTDYVFCADNANRMYASTDGGTTWAEVTSWYSTVNRTVADIFVDASTTTSNLTIYASTVGGPLYKSTNGGTKWATANGNLPAATIYDFNGGMKDGQAVLYVAVAGNGVWKSTDGGATWAAENNGLQLRRGRAHGTRRLRGRSRHTLYVGSQENCGPTVYKLRQRRRASWA